MGVQIARRFKYFLMIIMMGIVLINNTGDGKNTGLRPQERMESSPQYQ